jgi:UDP-N-acetylglucosamine diphosphorylase/glucosamine-1-phosphate N-acetyltransferase
VTRLYLREPAADDIRWMPFLGARPIAELRAGAWRIRERWERALGIPAAAILGGAAEGFHELDEPMVASGRAIAGPAVIALSSFAPAAGPIPHAPDVRRLESGGRTVAWLIPDGVTWSGPDDAGEAREIAGVPLEGSWDLITAVEELLGADCLSFGLGTGDPLPTGSVVLGDQAQVIIRGAAVEPGVVFDVRHGPVVLEEGVEVRHGSRLEGPLYAGPHSRLLGGHLRHSALGPRCSVKGELSTSVLLGYANKSHDGFVGHSVLGHWVNLGALTTTSNLKNTYGRVRLDLPGGRIETGRMFLGTLFGDHVKTAIGTMLSTGSVVGTGANLFGNEPVPRYVAPFSWGNAGRERLNAEGFVRTAERVMPRRDIEVTSERREWLGRLHRRMTDEGGAW